MPWTTSDVKLADFANIWPFKLFDKPERMTKRNVLRQSYMFDQFSIQSFLVKRPFAIYVGFSRHSYAFISLKDSN